MDCGEQRWAALAPSSDVPNSKLEKAQKEFEMAKEALANTAEALCHLGEVTQTSADASVVLEDLSGDGDVWLAVKSLTSHAERLNVSRKVLGSRAEAFAATQWLMYLHAKDTAPATKAQRHEVMA